MITPAAGETWNSAWGHLVTVTRYVADTAEVEFVHHGETARHARPIQEFLSWYTRISTPQGATACDCGSDKAGINARGGGAHSHFCTLFTKERFK